MNEWIEIRELEVEGKIGVLEEERKNRQRMLVSLRFQIETAFAEVGDQLVEPPSGVVRIHGHEELI